MRMKKNDLIISLANVLSTRRESRAAVDRLFAEMKRALRAGDKIVIAGFGSFHPVIARAKTGRNPRTGAALTLAPRRKVRFRQAKDLFA